MFHYFSFFISKMFIFYQINNNIFILKKKGMQNYEKDK